jgi:transcription antitermination factor NusG
MLTKREIENYCPLNRVVKQWSDRKKTILEPLFTSYVFVHTTEQALYMVKQASGDIVNFVYWLGKPAVIKDAEIENIKRFLNEYTNVKLQKNFVHVGDRIRVMNGPLMNREGKITAVRNNKVKLLLPSMGYIMVAEVKLSNVELVNYNYNGRMMAS